MQRLFVAPFFVMAAWKTVAGTYLSPTLPVMMIPNSDVPLVATDDTLTAEEPEMRVAAAVCSLYFRMRAPERLRDWVGKIKSLDILISSPLRRYDSYTAFLPQKRVTSDNYCRCLDTDTGEVIDRRVSTVTLPLAWRATMTGLGSETTDDCYDNLKFYPFASVPFSGIDIADKWGAAGRRGIGDFLYGTLTSGLQYPEITRPENRETRKAKAITLTGTGALFSLKTRPLKLSGAGEFKKCRKCHLRGHYTPGNITMTVYGSRDMIHWWPIARRSATTMVTLPRSSFRFYQVEISGKMGSEETLEGLTLT